MIFRDLILFEIFRPVVRLFRAVIGLTIFAFVAWCVYHAAVGG